MTKPAQPRIANVEEAVTPKGLFYVTDTEPGITRRKCGLGFSFLYPDGERVSPEDRARAKALAVPPSYQSVWICLDANGHLQATGLDNRGRKQYRYHPDWASWRSLLKYEGLVQFGEKLGRLRRKVHSDLNTDAGERSFALAAVVFLIDRTALRVGDEAYLRENGSYGATNLLSRHVHLTDKKVRLSFRGKGGTRVVKTLNDKRLHRILEQIGDLPGRHLFSYIGPDGNISRLHSHEVNTYITSALTVEGATAKTFRTWAGTLSAFEVALASPDKLAIKDLTKAASDRLSNTPAVCRTSYIHPKVLHLTEFDTEARQDILSRLSADGDKSLRVTERKLLNILT